MTESVDALMNPLITIGIIFVVVIAIAQIVEFTLGRSARIAISNIKDDEKRQKYEGNVSEAQKNIKIGFKIFNMIATALAVGAIVIFVFFQSNWAAPSPHLVEKIEQAPLPEGFTAPTTNEIALSNEISVNKESEKKEHNPDKGY